MFFFHSKITAEFPVWKMKETSHLRVLRFCKLFQLLLLHLLETVNPLAFISVSYDKVSLRINISWCGLLDDKKVYSTYLHQLSVACSSRMDEIVRNLLSLEDYVFKYLPAAFKFELKKLTPPQHLLGCFLTPSSSFLCLICGWSYTENHFLAYELRFCTF